MALLHRVPILIAVAVMGGLVAPVLIPLGTSAWRSHVTQAKIPDPPMRSCETQMWLNADRVCLTWTAPRGETNTASNGVALMYAGKPDPATSTPKNAIR